MCIQECEPSDAGEYICTLRNKLGADSCDAKLTIRKIYCPPQFAQKFGDLQQVNNKTNNLFLLIADFLYNL